MPDQKLESWVNQATDLKNKQERQVIHIILNAITKINYQFQVALKGGVLIAMRYGRFVETYDFNEIIAEKMRALLQQEVRDRRREQDIYDLYYLLNRQPVTDSKEKEDILMRLRSKSERRNLKVNRESMNNPEIKKRAARDYKNLVDTIEGDLPDFDISFSFVQSFYRNLPW